ncbi:hypothetical protein EVAR_21454_1 [Eumeta japonica]|uniref:Uncharacterized protein n=1 Tax=Eumeta variegata TaxID=151549 RepID=A0A4C1VFM9_EUMVA|nr:hypothetical protein EVAR_21454_1 [Eumeta japonica]
MTALSSLGQSTLALVRNRLVSPLATQYTITVGSTVIDVCIKRQGRGRPRRAPHSNSIPTVSPDQGRNRDKAALLTYKSEVLDDVTVGCHNSEDATRSPSRPSAHALRLRFENMVRCDPKFIVHYENRS